jgi:hypothetical protein
MSQASKLVAFKFMPQDGDDVLGFGGYKDKVLRIVKSKPDGIGTSDVAKALEISFNTTVKMLRELEMEREIYSVKIGKATAWHPNGRLVHPYLELFKELRGTPYRVSVQEGRSGPIVQIQERSYSLLSGERVEGAIFVEYANLEGLIDALNEIKTRFENFGEGRVTT